MTFLSSKEVPRLFCTRALSILSGKSMFRMVRPDSQTAHMSRYRKSFDSIFKGSFESKWSALVEDCRTLAGRRLFRPSKYPELCISPNSSLDCECKRKGVGSCRQTLCHSERIGSFRREIGNRSGARSVRARGGTTSAHAH